MTFFLYIFIFNFTLISIAFSDQLINFNLTIKTPGIETSPRETSYNSVHVKYVLPSNDDQWSIVEIIPFIEKSNGIVQRITVHLCQVEINQYRPNSIWYDAETVCDDFHSMLIYQWGSYSPLSSFKMLNDFGFEFDQSKLIVLSVTYFKHRKRHNDQTGVILQMTNTKPRLYMGTILIGNKNKQTHFSCRSLNYPRLLYGVQPLFRRTNNSWWQIYTIRHRSFGRKLIQPVLDSTSLSEGNQTNIEIISSDVFMLEGDYFTVECQKTSRTNCHFILFYSYKDATRKSFINTNHICETNDFPELFKLIPSKTNVQSQKLSSSVSNFNINGTTIFLSVCGVLITIWILIIIGCIIMRRVRGLVNFRSEPIGLNSYQNAKCKYSRKQSVRDNTQHTTTAEGDRIAQLDVEHMGLMG